MDDTINPGPTREEALIGHPDEPVPNGPDGLGDCPMIAMDGVEPIFVRHMMIGAMAIRYIRAVKDLTYAEAAMHARATWDTDWETDPAPRSFEAAMEAVDSDLECWGD